MMRWKLPFLAMLLLALSVRRSGAQISAIKSFIQSNLVGQPVIHKSVDWSFDPDVSLKRSKLWQQVNGVKGERLIEILGLGIDGEAEERLARQRARDVGHLGGLNYFQP